MKRPYRLFVCLDFPDDLRFAAYTRASLEGLFRLYHSWGATRLYWIYTWKHREGLWRCLPSRAITENTIRTRRALGEFLPAAVSLAHGLGLEFYATYKPFDLAFDMTFPPGSPAARRYGRLDALGGRVFWAADCLVRNQALRIQRRQDDLPDDLAARAIGSLVLRADRKGRPRLRPDQIAITVSDDNAVYRPLRRRGLTAHEYREGGERVIRLDGLALESPYLALETPADGPRGTFANRLSRLASVLDPRGRALPFTYGLYSYANRFDGFRRQGLDLRPDLPRSGYLFNWAPSPRAGFLDATRYALDNARGFLALAKGKPRYVTGALSPAYPRVRALWLEHIRECLAAGVDGVDLRVGNHNRNLEWEQYGFEPPVLEAFRERFGHNPGASPRDARRRQAILGESYTEFVRAASTLIHARGKKTQIHIGHDEVRGGNLPIRWDWERWIEEGLADELTLMTDYPSRYTARVARLAAPRGIPMYFRKYLNSITYRPRWPRMFRRYLRQSRALGHAGFMLYESAMVVRGRPDGTFDVRFPDIPRILAEEGCGRG